MLPDAVLMRQNRAKGAVGKMGRAAVSGELRPGWGAKSGHADGEYRAAKHGVPV